MYTITVGAHFHKHPMPTLSTSTMAADETTLRIIFTTDQSWLPESLLKACQSIQHETSSLYFDITAVHSHDAIIHRLGTLMEALNTSPNFSKKITTVGIHNTQPFECLNETEIERQARLRTSNVAMLTMIQSIQFSHTQTLDLGHCQLSGRGTKTCHQLLSAIPEKITSLSLKANGFSLPNELISVFKSLPATIIELDLSDNNLGRQLELIDEKDFASSKTHHKNWKRKQKKSTLNELESIIKAVPITVKTINLDDNGLPKKTHNHLLRLFYKRHVRRLTLPCLFSYKPSSQQTNQGDNLSKSACLSS